MSDVNNTPVWYPPQFPLQGRLPRRAAQLYKNTDRQSQLEYDYHDALSVAAGRRVSGPCCHTLHVSLCFDGTGNNLNNDFYLSDLRHPTNIARLFRASIGEGYAGGTGHTDAARQLTEAPGTGTGRFFKYYMPGVGTPFPEVGDLDYGVPGLALASYGEERINWGLLMIIDALRRALKLPRLGNATQLAAVKAMGTPHGFEWIAGAGNRRSEFYKQFGLLLDPLRLALRSRPGQCRLLGMKLYVYGFSRGAAAARAFVNWLNALLCASETSLGLEMDDVRLPITVEYLGLLDTVASVGVADIVHGARGHQGWADGSQALPTNELVKRCLHIVASHEQRLCFPLDSIRREDGSYPANSLEVLHPGVHSDQGGGYPPGDQGKAISKDNAEGDGLLLSQIALNDLYADAFAHGAPLKVPKDSLPSDLRDEQWRAMEYGLMKEFDVSPTLVNRFNAWRQVTLGLHPAAQPLPVERVERYEPLPGNEPLERALRTQMGWLTAWRIDRYGFASLLQTPFFKAATDDHAEPARRAEAKAERDKKHDKIVGDRKAQLADEHYGQSLRQPLKPGFKDFDPDMAKTQLREAAEEFAQAYRERLSSTVAIWAASMVLPGYVAGVRADHLRLKAEGQALVGQLFPPPLGERNHFNEHRQGNVEEWRNANKPEGLLRALFDDQVHDSRAWFLYGTQLEKLGVGRREPFGSYLRDRMVFFGEVHSRGLALYDDNDQRIVAGDPRLQGVEQMLPPQPQAMTAERMAAGQKAIADRWDAYYAQLAGRNDAST